VCTAPRTEHVCDQGKSKTEKITEVQFLKKKPGMKNEYIKEEGDAESNGKKQRG
jgi:hypothetical protein